MFTERQASLAAGAVAVVLTVGVGVRLTTSESTPAEHALEAIEARGRQALGAIEDARREAIAALEQPPRIESGRWRTDADDWKQAVEDEQGGAILERPVRFARPFPRAPTVATALAGVDPPAAASVSAAEVTAEGFLLQLRVRPSRAAGAVEALWIAHPAAGAATDSVPEPEPSPPAESPPK